MTSTEGKVLSNPMYDAARTYAHAPDEVSAFHRSFADYAPTRLSAIPGIAEVLGVAEVWVKDESNRLALPSFKILGASWATFRALCAWTGQDHRHVDGVTALRELLGAHRPELVAATDGNHGRAVARMATLLGLDAHILVPQDMASSRIEALESEGAQVTIVPGNYDEAIAASARLADGQHIVISDTSWDGYEEVPNWVIDGYATITHEICEQLADGGRKPPTVIAAQIGVGAFAASVVRGFATSGVTVIGVEPTKADCLLASIEAGTPTGIGGQLDSIMAGLNCGHPSVVAWPDLASGVRHFVSVNDSDAEHAMRLLADAGIVSGESGAAGLAGLLAHRTTLDLKPDDRVLVISTEGATDPKAYQRIVSGNQHKR